MTNFLIGCAVGAGVMFCVNRIVDELNWFKHWR